MANQKVSTQEEIESREIIEKIKAHYRKEWGLSKIANDKLNTERLQKQLNTLEKFIQSDGQLPANEIAAIKELLNGMGMIPSATLLLTAKNAIAHLKRVA